MASENLTPPFRNPKYATGYDEVLVYSVNSQFSVPSQMFAGEDVEADRGEQQLDKNANIVTLHRRIGEARTDVDRQQEE